MKRHTLLTICAVVIGCSTNRTIRLDTLAGSSRGLSRITSEDVGEFAPSLGAEGSILLFDTRYSTSSEIVGIDPNSGGRRTVFTSSSSRSQEPAWAKNGRFFVYTSNSSGSWSLVRSISRSPNAAISIIVSGQMAPIISDPDISPDGKRVAFGTRIRGRWNVAVSDISGGSFTVMGEGINPSWSPDGTRIAFVRAANRRAHIFTMDAATGTDVVQITTGENDNFDPAWSPEGHLLVFTSNRSSKKAPRAFSKDLGERRLTGRGRSKSTYQLFAVKPDGTGVVQLTDGEGINVQPFWGSDGWIYFSSNQAGNFDIWRLRPSGELLATAP